MKLIEELVNRAINEWGEWINEMNEYGRTDIKWIWRMINEQYEWMNVENTNYLNYQNERQG